MMPLQTNGTWVPAPLIRANNPSIYPITAEHNAYASSEAVVHAYVDIAFTSGALGYKLAFRRKGVGELNQDYMRVWLVPASYTPIAGNQISDTAVSGAVNLSGDLRGKGSWQAAEYFIPSSWAGTGRLVYE